MFHCGNNYLANNDYEYRNGIFIHIISIWLTATVINDFKFIDSMTKIKKYCARRII